MIWCLTPKNDRKFLETDGETTEKTIAKFHGTDLLSSLFGGDIVMKRLFRLSAILFLILAICSGPAAWAQNDKGFVAGHVSDSSGSVLQGAAIELQPTGITVVSNQQGSYFVNNLAPGTYTITVTYVGFALFTKVFNITAGQSTTLDVKMEVASQKDQVIVTAQAASGEAEDVNREKTADNVLQVTKAKGSTFRCAALSRV